MFSKELENLIQATLEDGVLEEYEKAALVKRAQAEGVDLTELEIYINSLLQKRKRESEVKKEAEYSEAEKKKKEEFGKVCPACGQQVPPLTLKCECGYEFTNAKVSYSMQILSERLNAISLTDDEIKEIEHSAEGDKAGKRSDFLALKQINMITTFPIPNTKEDIIDFLSTSISLANKKIGFLDQKKNYLLAVLLAGIIIPVAGWVFGLLAMDSKSFSEEKLKRAWRAKSEQVLIKGRSLRGDPEFTRQLDYYENLLRE
jgi:hypothetical protein